VFFTKLRNRLLRPLLDADTPPAKTEIRQALRTLENAVADYIQAARLARHDFRPPSRTEPFAWNFTREKLAELFARLDDHDAQDQPAAIVA
jgi:glutathione S-transferase